MSKKNVVRLLVRLFGDPTHLEKLRKNPAATLAAAGLSPAERELLLSGSDAKIRAYLGADSDRAAIKAKTVAIKAKAVQTARSKRKPRRSRQSGCDQSEDGCDQSQDRSHQGQDRRIKGKTAASRRGPRRSKRRQLPSRR